MTAENMHNYIERLSNLLRNEVRRTSADYGLQPVQIEALHYLSICNRYSDTPMAVTEYLGQTKGTVSQTLKVLERKGYVTKSADMVDRRVTHLKVTAAGKQLLSKVIPGQNFSVAYESMDEDLQAQINGSLNALLKNILQASGSRTFGVCKTCRYNRSDNDENYFCELVKTPLSHKEVVLVCREHELAVCKNRNNYK